MLWLTNNFPENFNWVRSRLLFCKVLQFKRTQCFCFLHLNFIITWSFVLMWWQACRLSSSTDILVSDSVWHTDWSRTSRVSLLLYLALFRLLHSNWVICSSRSSLQGLEINRLELTISYFAWKLLKRLFSSENFKLLSLLKFLRLRILRI